MRILSENKLNPIAYHLAKIDWSQFGTLSWDRDAATSYSEASEQIRQNDFYRLIGHTCGRLRLRPRNLAIYGKTEWGMGMRGHFNYLVSRDGTKDTPPELLAATMLEYWSRKHGVAVIKLFDANLQGRGVTISRNRNLIPATIRFCILNTFPKR